MKRTDLLAASTLIVVAGFTGAPAAGATGSPSAACNQLGGNVQSGNICEVRAQAPNYTIAMRFDTDYPDDQPIADYLIQSRDQFVAEAQSGRGPHMPHEMSVSSTSYRSGQPTRTTPEYGQRWHGTNSLVLENFQMSYTDYAGTRFKSFTFDYDQNRPVTFDNLFAPGTHPIDSIYPLVAEETARQFHYRNGQLPPSIGQNPDTYKNFAITDDAVIFFFDTAQFLPLEAAYFSASIPRASLPQLQL
jgi:hypothetical protein